MTFFRHPSSCVKALAFVITALTIVSVLYHHCAGSWHSYSTCSVTTRHPYKVFNDAGILLSSNLTEKMRDFNLKNPEWNDKFDKLVAEPRDVWQKADSQNTVKRGWEEGGMPVVVVVEEHHDVIPHWFTAADLGLLPRRGNTLVHIDAHPDVVLPLVNASFPLFRYPGSSELVYLMQRNDMFITSAGLTGMFSRFIWITPPWDEKLTNSLGSYGYRRFHISVGLLTQKAEEKTKDTSQDENRPLLCYCMESILSGHGKTGASDGHACYLHNTFGPANPTGATVLIQRSRCKKKHHILAEIVTETKALELVGATEGERPADDSLSTEKHRWKGKDSVLQSHRDLVPWMSEDDSVILDIDEDYYGVESATTPLQNAQKKQRSRHDPRRCRDCSAQAG